MNGLVQCDLAHGCVSHRSCATISVHTRRSRPSLSELFLRAPRYHAAQLAAVRRRLIGFVYSKWLGSGLLCESEVW